MRWMVFNVLGFQAVWWACVLGAGEGSTWPGPLAAAVFVALHLRFTPTPGRDLRLLTAAVLLGLLFDGLLGASGAVAYATANEVRALAPAWILALWAGFGLTLTHSMAFFATRPVAAALFGLVGGPLAYASAGAVAGAASFPQGVTIGLGAVALAWALAMPLLYAIDRRFGAVRQQAAA